MHNSCGQLRCQIHILIVSGHGTYLLSEDHEDDMDTDDKDKNDNEDGKHELYASLAGTVERVNKLVSVIVTHARYTPQIGDVVVGRVVEVSSKRWRVDVYSRQDAVLLLSSVNLPGGVQRRKLESDALQMREFFAEGDLVVSEVQQFFNDGAISLHTRSLKYGKLRNGCLVKVQSSLIKRSNRHFHELSGIGVDMILGVNGYVWVSMHTPELTMEDIENDNGALYSNKNAIDIPIRIRENIARVRNCVVGLSAHSVPISDVVVMQMFEASMEFAVKDILLPDTLTQLMLHLSELTQ